MKKNISGVILLFTAAAAFAADFGVVLGAEGEYAGALKPEGFSVTGSAGPWVSVAGNGGISFYAAGKLAYEYGEGREPPGNFLFEPERIELTLRPASFLSLTLGRQRFEDALGMAASGLFDGLGGAASFGTGRLFLGVFYTGLLYKETANIVMTSGDLQNYEKPLDAAGGYFASRRVLLALTGEFPALLPGLGLTAQCLAQVDVNGTAEPLHSQYLELGLTAELLETLHLAAGALGELIQAAGTGGGAALSGGLDWEVPGGLNDLVSANFFWTSGSGGSGGSGVRAFSPVGGVSGGRVFDPGLGALMSGGLWYRARPAAGLSAEVGAAYFIRTDLVTLGDGELEGSSKSRLLGGEVSGSLIWAPDPALRLNLGGGAFFPRWGAAFRADAPIRWKANLGLIVSL